MRHLIDIVGHPVLHETIQMILEASPDEVRTLFGWIVDAWRHALPKPDLNYFETQCRWCTIDKAIKLCRKIGVSCMIYEHYRNIMPFRIELTPAIRHVIIKGHHNICG